LVSYIIGGSQNINALNTNGETPLHLAARVGNKEIVSLLIQNGAFVNSIDTKNRTPLHYAVKHGHIDIVQLLLDNNAQVTVSNDNTQFLLPLLSLFVIYIIITRYLYLYDTCIMW
jgi:ankyrin repeat protein